MRGDWGRAGSVTGVRSTNYQVREDTTINDEEKGNSKNNRKRSDAEMHYSESENLYQPVFLFKGIHGRKYKETHMCIG